MSLWLHGVLQPAGAPALQVSLHYLPVLRALRRLCTLVRVEIVPDGEKTAIGPAA